ncbi:diphosphomevalonate decarboxylase [Streptomyces sp. NBC_00237]|uniref:diphosphomevalonate decarboxylase n=1 Tax=Streptomyces sp. NBC_00237 TaxID=2975687 RepID=UPI002252E364|nr:diphosphomevalonate decarboxylase [Streptomyces sp. NBC_00237]MCX5205736.1 diphosphomevalonate decarboxylase [Streptomyces sp. NBC_00237]
MSTSPMEATAVAHPNIALAKYWGKRDEALVIPCADSLSMTLDVYPTTTKVRLRPGAVDDVVLIDGEVAQGESRRRVARFLDLVRRNSTVPHPVAVDTRNTVPVGAGLASSAAGFAALSLAAATVYRLDLDAMALSRLARRGSGSAARSIFGGFVHWHAGDADAPDPDLASYAEPVTGVRLDAALIVVLVERGPKPVSSREAMRRTQATSPAYADWLATTHTDVPLLRKALVAGDLETVGRISERNALGMHLTMEAAVPPVVYRTPASHRVLAHVSRLRDSGERVWATMDAGPNVKVLCPATEAVRLADRLRAATGCPTLVARVGPGTTLRQKRAGS